MGRSPCCSKQGMNRGAWTAEEDHLLTRYIESHGVGKWRSLPKKAGLNRCGKSCRLRWLNYLRPDIKRGNISPDEEDLIIRLHKLLGNRWSLIAGRLPGRTDNEIKNYWNTNLGKRVLLENRFPISASSSSIRPTKPHSRKLMIFTSSNPKLAATKKYSFIDQQVIKTKALKCSSNQLLEYQQQNLAEGKRINNIDTVLETSSSNELSCVDGTSSNSHTNNAVHEGSDELIMTMDFGGGAEISLSELLLGCEDLCDFNMISSGKGTEPELLISSEEMLDEGTWNNIDVIDQKAA